MGSACAGFHDFPGDRLARPGPMPRWLAVASYGDLRLVGEVQMNGSRLRTQDRHAQAMIDVAMIRLMAARMAGEDIEPPVPSRLKPPDASPKTSEPSSQPVYQHPLSSVGDADRSRSSCLRPAWVMPAGSGSRQAPPQEGGAGAAMKGSSRRNQRGSQ